jgi:hypothetical protein
LNATVTPNAGLAYATFVWGPGAAYGSETSMQPVAGVGGVPVSATLTGLTPNTTYHFGITIGSADGTAVGSDATFKTAPTPVTAPKLGHLKVAIRSHHRVTVTYTDSQKATTRLRIFRRRYGKLVALKRRITHHDKPGHNTVRFRLTLKPGSYKLTATATAGGKHSGTAAKRFRIKS